ncbi:MAG: hypothetical protein J2P17_34070, partial [Mycobacterium sp.]|nr:hypothetical protein [Mycobacterium sp.]
VERRIPGNRHQLFPSLRDPSGWLTQRGTSCDTQFVLQANGYDDEEFGDANRIVPRDGTIECQILEAKRPSYVVSTWTWRRNDADRVPAREIDERTAAILVPPQPQMTLRFDLETAPKLDGLPTSIVRVTHDFVPLEWVDDLSAYWRWMFERADYQFDLGNIRRKTPVPRIEIPPGD